VTAPSRGRRVPPGDLVAGTVETVPGPVHRAHGVLDQLGIWYRFARNTKAMSCRDAAARRDRLGSIGIPVWDEMKSLALSDGSVLVFAHCRGDQALDLSAVATAAGTGPLDLAGDEHLAPLGLGYGLINPFISPDVAASTGLIQVFDVGLSVPIDVPGTIMTNAGDRTWGVEFYGADLAAATPGAISAPIAMEDPEADPRPPAIGRPFKIGIITGNSPESGMVLWELINGHVRTQLARNNVGDVSMPPVEVQSVPAMGLSMELDLRLEPVREAVEGAARALVDHGCTHVALACNTTQYFGDELSAICAAGNAEFLSMPDAVARWLTARGITEVGMVGIRYVSDLGEWSAYRAALAPFTVEPLSERGMGRITDIGYQIKAEGPTKGALGRLHNVLRDEFDSHTIVLALTELSLLLDLQTGKPRPDAKQIVDPLHVYAEAIACAYTGAPFAAEPPDADDRPVTATGITGVPPH
jgi:aspartate/glutamate racemase/prolyl-tRNA editing enzyme YbaK/EbsC (Cys-tRNA(Pro) deacylase)